MRLSSRSRTGSARAAKAPASVSASAGATGYANFAISEPPLKLVLIEGQATPGSLNHLGVEVETTDEVTAATARLAGEGLDTATEDQVSCCYALQDKVWVRWPRRRGL